MREDYVPQVDDDHLSGGPAEDNHSVTTFNTKTSSSHGPSSEKISKPAPTNNVSSTQRTITIQQQNRRTLTLNQEIMEQFSQSNQGKSKILLHISGQWNQYLLNQ